MLELKQIVKVYPSGGENVTALKGIDLRFRNNEFVSILGPSGCGKTTMLNIIGGLDHYTEGDLFINGRSTKEYKDRDWDTYRNHSIGFVFQSYNLIPHQTVLSNVELALTLSGVGKRERRERAKKALEAVGLGNQLRKKPAQMSGGQMQRVAIARAIVNDPDIILADEPTGALDSETSVQVMDILKNIAKDRLVVMVTHNPELAEQYSTRIIRMLDGRVLDDSRPIGEEEFARLTEEDKARAEAAAVKNRGLKKRASMSLPTAFGLSLNNLFTKKGRTILTSFAGSIGIIGIALIYAVSQGTSDYIEIVQQDTLSGYPLAITQEAADFTAMISGFMSSSKAADEERRDGSVTEQQLISSLVGGIGTNDLRSFRAHLVGSADELSQWVNSISYNYGVSPVLYTRDVNGDLLEVNPGRFASYMSMGGYGMSLFSEMIDNQEYLDAQYELLAGRWPESDTEMVLYLNDPDRINDLLTYSIGLHGQNELMEMVMAVMNGQTPEVTGPIPQWSYEDLLALDFRLMNAGDRYRYDAAHNVWEDLSGDKAYMERVFDNSVKIRVSGIVTARDGVTATALSPGFNYLPGLTLRSMQLAADSAIVQMQQADREVNVFSGKRFGEEDENAGIDFSEMISVDGDALTQAFRIDIDSAKLTKLLSGYLQSFMGSLSSDMEKAGNAFSETFSKLAKGLLEYALAERGSDGRVSLRIADARELAGAYLETPAAQKLLKSLASKYGADQAQLSQVSGSLLELMVTREILAEAAANAGGETPDEPGARAEPGEESGAESGEESGTTEESGEESEVPAEPGEESGSLPDPGELIGDLMNYAWEYGAEDIDAAVSEFTSGPVMGGVATAVGEMLIGGGLEDRVTKAMTNYMGSLMKSMMGSLRVDEEAIAKAFQFNMTEDDMMRLMTALSGSTSASSAAANLNGLGYADAAEPVSISVYLKDFEAKEEFIAFIDAYNKAAEDAEEPERVIRYTDITGVLMSSVTTIIDAITYVLIAFVAISLIVSSIMIGVITLISVQERTKEIGILRAIGASKQNVSSMFNAETVIIGLSSGLIGIGVTYLLIIPINIILENLTNIAYLKARLPIEVAIVLVLISMLLTLFAGIIPSGSAAKKDPVVALRTE